MEDVFVKETHTGKIEVMCECCGGSFLLNSSAKKERWCSNKCRDKLVKGKKRPSLREPSVRDLVDKYYDDSGSDFIDDMEV